MEILSIEKLIIYPIKSFAGIEVDACNALKSGFEWDRRWMLVDKENNFISQRNHSILALFKTSIENSDLIVSFQNQKLSFEKNQETGKILNVKIWKDRVNAFEVSASANSFFSNMLKQNVKLVKLKSEDKRIKVLNETPFETDVSLADGYPYLIVGTESINTLNAKLEQKIDYRRFRPNIIVKTFKAHEEDKWKTMKIGNLTVKMIKPCVRCNVIGIDQDNGNSSKEPTLSLSKYRKEENNIIFGMNAIALSECKIKIEDKIQIFS